jgi:predicted aspartyl protease
MLLSCIALGLAAAPAQAECSITTLTKLPVTIARRTPMVPVTINGQRIELIADSGAFLSFLSPDTAARLGLALRPAPPSLNLWGINGKVQASLALAKSVVIGDITLPNAVFIVGGGDIKEGGLLGQNILGLADIDYDLAHGVIRLLRTDGCDDADLARWAAGKPYSTLALAPAGTLRHVIGTVKVNGKPVRAVFDSGTPFTILSLRAAARVGITPRSPGVMQGVALTGSGSGVVQSWIAPIASVEIGEREAFRDIRLLIGEIGEPEMLIGVDFFLSHRILILPGQRKMVFTYSGGPPLGVPAAFRPARR